MFYQKGCLVALVTPMEADGSISWQHLNDLIDWHIESGTSGIVVVGTTGESATINVTEHVQIIEIAVEHANNRIPVIAGTGANSTKEATYLTSAAKQAGASAALLVTPYYNKPTQQGLIDHYLEIANEVDLPQILYNVPSRTGCDMLPETVFELAQHKNIVGLKEALPDLKRLEELKDVLKEVLNNKSFLLYSGDDSTSTEFLIKGGHGTISVSANIVPKRMSKIFDLVNKGLIEEAKEVDSKLSILYEDLFIESSPIPVKWALNKLGRIPVGIRLPLTVLKQDFHNKIVQTLAKLGLLE